MHTLPQKHITRFQQKILEWYEQNQRDLPWRKTRDPYHILVSEIMLQQTQVNRVIPKFKAWLQAFPTLEALALAKTADVLKMWSGLGYNRRALNLQRAAQQAISMIDGMVVNDEKLKTLPDTVDELKKLPGIGEYSARAVACFAFDQQIAVVDTNIRKVIAVEFFNGVPPDPKTTQNIADELLPQGKAYEWNQALMDYASTVLTKEKISVPKQTAFKNSNRYYRGQILKRLVNNPELSIEELAKQFKPRESDISWLVTIIDGLEKDRLIQRNDTIISLP